MSLDTLSNRAETIIPEPRKRWKTRVLLPAVLVGVTTLLILSSAWRTLFPGTVVQVLPVMVKNMEATVGSTAVIASGWVEPDPFAYYVTALAPGTIQEVPILEGQRVQEGDVIARLIPDDANLALARSQAELVTGLRPIFCVRSLDHSALCPPSVQR